MSNNLRKLRKQRQLSRDLGWWNCFLWPAPSSSIIHQKWPIYLVVSHTKYQKFSAYFLDSIPCNEARTRKGITLYNFLGIQGYLWRLRRCSSFSNKTSADILSVDRTFDITQILWNLKPCHDQETNLRTFCKETSLPSWFFIKETQNLSYFYSAWLKFNNAKKLSGSSDAPPTRAPSTSGQAMYSYENVSGFTEPPY